MNRLKKRINNNLKIANHQKHRIQMKTKKKTIVKEKKRFQIRKNQKKLIEKVAETEFLMKRFRQSVVNSLRLRSIKKLAIIVVKEWIIYIICHYK